ncbi:TrkA-N domain protein [Haloquadratum walsbyi]|jgi:TrkA-N domain.|uniref:TrkA-N domain protein n=1 Tax=Haloquadratum walsbyi J07HQW2 TaxID=1238425 RepID=U1MY33_9EURY|nr:TrkA-N domain protein [Haloquadratum walsbyi]ERG95379.1 MAG: TrkA-N domain protein [Haloquadratum walsbyi J07HQW2]
MDHDESQMFLVAGPDENNLAAELTDCGVEITEIDEMVTHDSLEAAGLATADTLVLTTMDDASAIPVAKEQNPAVRVVTYTSDSLPEFARGQTDLAIDPTLLNATVVAEELTGS